MIFKRPDKEQVKELLLLQIENVCRHLLPNGKIIGNDWVSGSVDGENGKSLRVQIRGDKLGLWIDFATDEKGDIFELWSRTQKVPFVFALKQAEKFLNLHPIEIKTKNFDWDKCVEAFDEIYCKQIAEKRGYSPDFVEYIKNKKLIGIYKGCIAFPVSEEEQAIKCHYKNGDNWIYYPTGLPNYVYKFGEGKDVWLFESQWDALAVADKMGFHEGRVDATFIATRGSQNAHLLQQLKLSYETKVFAFNQNDKKTKNGLNASEKWFNDVIHACPQAKLVKIPNPHKDANDWCKTGIADIQILKLISEETKRSKTGLPPTENLVDFLSREIKKPDEIIEGMLHAGTKMSINGPSKAFKSWALLDLLVSVASGATFWGNQCYKTNVLWVNFEITEAFSQRRLRDVVTAKKLENIPTNITAWNLRGFACGAEEIVQDIIDEVINKNYGVVCIDPVYKMLGDRDENSAGDINNLMNEFERVCRHTGAAVLFAHHYAKGDAAAKEAIDRGSGSGVWARDPDTLIMVTPHEVREHFTVDFTFRNFAPKDSFVIKREHPLMIPVMTEDPTCLRKAGERNVNYETILSCLKGEMTTKEWQMACYNEFNVSRSVFFSKYSYMKTKPNEFKIHQSALNEKWQRMRQ
jgi:hypothetical protein